MNTIQKIDLSKLKKCNQVWDDMSKTEKGRLCEKCAHTIIDFRDLNDKEVAEKHMFSTEKVCGLYTKGQLKAPKTVSLKTKRNKFNSIAAGVLAMLSTNVVAQTKTNPVKVEQVNTDGVIDYNFKNNSVEIDNDKVDSLFTIVGIVLDENNEPLPFSRVYIKGLKIGCVSDVEGRYSLSFSPSNFFNDSLIVVCQYIGYATEEVHFKTSNFSESKMIIRNLVLNHKVEITEFLIYEKQPLRKRIWSRITRPFRRRK